MELRDKNDFALMGWYIGRYENGVRHGVGQDVMIEREDETYKIIPRIYDRGLLVMTYQNLDNDLIVTDILSNLDFFGFMGLIDQQDE
jgi:hypothetical protein